MSNPHKLPRKISIADKYGPAMAITEQIDADAYFWRLVEHSRGFGLTKEAAEELERHNLAYFAGYYSHETRLRVEKLFQCEHPFFGPATKGPPTLDQALSIGMAIGRAMKAGASK
jgi:hypothetical protein